MLTKGFYRIRVDKLAKITLAGVFLFGVVLGSLSNLVWTAARPKLAKAQSAQPTLPRLQLTELGTHPQAAAQPTTDGKSINSLKVFDGKLFAGYGDYQNNTGPIIINPFNLSTNTFEGQALSVPSEAIGNWTVINGSLYATTIDPNCSKTCPAGYAKYTPGGSWSMQTPINAEHVFAMASLNGSDLWLFGSAGGYTSTAWRSTDGGSTWAVVRTYANESSSNLERYYWGIATGGKMYMQSNLYGFQNPVEAFDGTNWTSNTSVPALCDTGTAGRGPSIIVHQSKIICAGSSWNQAQAMVYDGSTATQLDINSSVCGNSVYMLQEADGYVYALCRSWYDQNYSDRASKIMDSRIIRSKDLNNWQTITTFDSNLMNSNFTIESFAIDGSTLYVGDNNSKIYKTTFDAGADTTPPTGSVTTSAKNGLAEGSFTMSVDANDAKGDVYVEYYINGVVQPMPYSYRPTNGGNNTATNKDYYSPFTFDITNRYLQNDWQYPPDKNLVLTAKITDGSGNTTTTQPVTVHFAKPDINVSSLTTSGINLGAPMATDQAGNIWTPDINPFVSEELLGFIKVDPATGVTTKYPFASSHPSYAYVYDGGFTVDKTGHIWFVDCRSSQLHKFNPQTKAEVVSDLPFSVCTDSGTQMVLGSGSDMLILKRGSDQIVRVNIETGALSRQDIPSNYLVTTLEPDNSGQFMAAYATGQPGSGSSVDVGLANINAAGVFSSFYEEPYDANSILGNVWSIIKDQAGNIWISSDTERQTDGPLISVLTVSGQKKTFGTVLGGSYGHSARLHFTPSGMLVGQTADGAVVIIDPGTGNIKKHYVLSTVLPGGEVIAYPGMFSSLVIDKQGVMWVNDIIGQRLVKISVLSAATGSVNALVDGAASSNGSLLATTGAYLLATPLVAIVLGTIAYTFFDYRRCKRGLSGSPGSEAYTYRHHLQVVSFPLFRYRLVLAFDKIVKTNGKISRY